MADMLIDVTRLLGRFMKGRLPTGVDRVSLAYVGHFAERSQALVRLGAHWVVLDRSGSARLFGALLGGPAGVTAQALWPVLRAALGKGPAIALRGALLFNTGHSGLERTDWPAQVQRLGVRPVLMVHDLIPITHPEYCRAGERERHLVRIDNALRFAHGVITNSQATLDELQRHAARNGQPMPPTLACPLAPAVLPRPAPRRPMAQPYFVMLGTIEPRKNHWMLLQVWRRLVEQLGAEAPRLVLIGQRGWECENVADLLERCAALRGFVIEVSDCSDADLATYLHHCQALLFPSFAEGYGMPLVEALAAGVPVIAGKLAVYREIASDLPVYLDPLDGPGWTQQIRCYSAFDSGERRAQLQRLEAFVAPSWDSHFERVESFLREIA